MVCQHLYQLHRALTCEEEGPKISQVLVFVFALFLHEIRADLLVVKSDSFEALYISGALSLWGRSSTSSYFQLLNL